MAFPAEAAGNDAAVLRHATAAARRASQLASQRESAAQYERALRFSASADDSTLAGLYDGLADELSLVDRLDEATRLGTLRARRGEPGVWECLNEAVAYADGTGEPQMIVPVRLARAEAFWLEGQLTQPSGRSNSRCRHPPPATRGSGARSLSGHTV